MARRHFGQGGLYTVAAASGLTDVDAITLSTSQLIRSGTLAADTGWRVILIGALSNIGFKAGIVFAVSGGPLFRWLLPYFAVAWAAGALLVALWPASTA
jgi:uncharacterized membrane protein (DUF4010 family)